MPKRNLRIVKHAPVPMIGVSEACNQQFKSSKLTKATRECAQKHTGEKYAFCDIDSRLEFA